MEAATHEGTAGTPGEGPYMTFWLRVEGGVIRRAAFQTYGCAVAAAAGSITTLLLTGGTIEQVLLPTASEQLSFTIRRGRRSPIKISLEISPRTVLTTQAASSQ